jgi:hypothetical protein
VTLRRKFNGAKSYTEISRSIPKLGIPWKAEHGRRALNESGSQSESAGGSHSSENAGMSSEKYVRIILAESLRILEEGSSAPGKPGAKVRPKGVADAHTVEIP